EKLARGRGHGRPAEMAPFRVADCLWMEGDRAKAAASYAKLAKSATARTGDVALARFRVAEHAAERNRDAARPQFLAIARDFPAHPLADEALRRIGAGTPTTPPGPTTPPPPRPPAPLGAAAARGAAAAAPPGPGGGGPAPGRAAAARGVADEGPPLGRGARRAGEAARDAAARSGRRARLPDRHDEIPHAA